MANPEIRYFKLQSKSCITSLDVSNMALPRLDIVTVPDLFMLLWTEFWYESYLALGAKYDISSMFHFADGFRHFPFHSQPR